MLQYQNQSIRPLTTAHLAQTMTLLGMTSGELKQKIESELAKNPALELIDDRRCPSCQRIIRDPGPCPVCSRPKNKTEDEPIVFISSPNEHIVSPKSNNTNYSFDDLPDDNIAPEIDLPTYVLGQIASELTIEDRPIIAHILTNLDDDGFLSITPQEISQYHHVLIDKVEKLIQLIQKAEPIGVGSNTPTDAMLVQLQVLAERKFRIPQNTESAIREGLSLLSRHQYGELAKRLKISKSEVIEIADFIGKNLNPFPSRAHWGDIRNNQNPKPSVYHQPDIIINQLNQNGDNSLVVEILLPLRGTLQINQLFRKTTQNAPEETAEKWKKDLEGASLLIKCIQQRNHTMHRLMKYLATYQKKYILKGEQHLHPITRAEIAKQLGVHESTISRAVSGKCLQLPSGKIVPLSQFFDRSLHIRAKLKEIIQNETQTHTDSQLVTILSKQDIQIARRTVAKYRAMEGILPAHIRKNLRRPKKNNGQSVPASINT
jgi:RNA polymerase sigma-54 factor